MINGSLGRTFGLGHPVMFSHIYCWYYSVPRLVGRVAAFHFIHNILTTIGAYAISHEDLIVGFLGVTM